MTSIVGNVIAGRPDHLSTCIFEWVTKVKIISCFEAALQCYFSLFPDVCGTVAADGKQNFRIWYEGLKNQSD